MLPTLHAVESRMVQPTGVEVESINLFNYIKFKNRSHFLSFLGVSSLCKYLFLIVSSSAGALQRVSCVK